jgi:anti-sigma factor RsiW
MPCKNLRAQLPLYAGGELDAVQSAMVGRHLEACDSCRRGAEAYSADRAQLNRYGRELQHQNRTPDVFAALRSRIPELDLPARAVAPGPEARRRDEGFMA